MSTFWELAIGWAAIATLVVAAVIVLRHNLGGENAEL